MKLNKFFMVLAATALVACSNEDLSDFTATQAPEDSRLVELSPNFAIAGVGVENATTRTHWEQDAVSGALVNNFLPIWATAPSGTGLVSDDANLEAQAVGLCWLGQTPDENVYTNYQFYHYGWLNVGETTANIECNELMNGWMYDDIDVAVGDAAGDEADPANFSANAAALAAKGGALPFTINYNSGVYKTDNKAIFGGDYIVYYPFNPNFKEAGTIPAEAKTAFDWDIAAVPANPWEAPELGKNTFRYSSPVHIDGGDQAADFGMYNLSTLVRLRVATVAGDANIGDAIDQVVLYSPSKKLLKQANLAADKIVAGQKGAGLYAETEGIKTITTNFVTTATALNVKATTTVSAYITVLPTTVNDLVALVHNSTDGTWATVDMGNTVFEAGKAKVLDITVAAADFKADYIAVDEASLTTALGEARAAIALDGTLRPTITVIGDITLEAAVANGITVTTPGQFDINAASDAKITIAGDDIIVPEDVTLNLKTNMASKVRVLGKSCCTGTNGGILDIQGGTVNNVTMEPTEAKVTAATYDTYNPAVYYTGAAAKIAAGKTFDVQAGNVYVNQVVDQKEGNFQIAEGAKVTVSATGNLSFLGTTVDNYGTIEVKKDGEFYMKNSNGTSVWSDGQKMTNHATGKFIHNVDAVVGTAVQFMNQETGSEYRCRVDKQKALDDAYVQWTACSVIEIVDGAIITYDLVSATQHTIWGSPKHVDIEVNNTLNQTAFNDTPSDGKQINIGNLTVKTPLNINYGDKGDAAHTQRTLTVNGNMTVSANTNLMNSKKITVTKNLDIDNGAKLTYAGSNNIKQGLAVGGDITVTGTGAQFDASANGGILISCTNFSLSTGATATFGNRTAGDSTNKTMEVKGTISNGAGCTFTISPAGGGNLLAWITCYKTEGAGTYAGTPIVVKP